MKNKLIFGEREKKMKMIMIWVYRAFFSVCVVRKKKKSHRVKIENEIIRRRKKYIYELPMSSSCANRADLSMIC